MTPAERWVRERLAEAPPELLEAMVGALPEQADDVPAALAEGAMRLYAALLHGCRGRPDALPLLAADALLTHALQAQAEADPSALSAVADRWGGAGRLGELAGGLPG